MQKTKAKKLRELMNAGTVVAPGVYDALGARIAQNVGFEAVYMTGNGAMASLLGKPDMGLATMSEMVTRAHQLAACVEIPLICDADTGYGGLGNVKRTVEEFESAGIAGIHIEDQVCPKRCGALGGVQVVSLHDSLLRLDTALTARKDNDFLIIARTDAKGVLGFDAAIERGKSYAAHGADAVMIEGMDSLDEIRRVVDSVDAPVLFNIYEHSGGNAFNVHELEQIGVKIIINCLTSTLYVSNILKTMMHEFKRTGTTAGFVDGMMPMDEYTHILGIEAEMELLQDNPSGT